MQFQYFLFTLNYMQEWVFLYASLSLSIPTLLFTIKSLPKYLLIVLAFAGDSTITSDFAIVVPRSLNLCGHSTCLFNVYPQTEVVTSE